MTESELAAVVKGLAPAVRDLVTKAAETTASALHDRLVTVERRLSEDVVGKDLGAVRERVAGLEARAPLAGPPGKDGLDGLGLEDLVAIQTDDRTIEIRAIRGDRVKTIGACWFPVDLYRGVHVEGKSYERGDNVTFQGAVWHCNEDTVERPNGGKAWTLKVKRGRDGKETRG